MAEAVPTFTVQSVETASGRIAYHDVGEGSVVLFVHGVLMNKHLWRHQLAAPSDTPRRRSACSGSSTSAWRVATGFPPHGHKNLEIVTYVVDGATEHWDDKGNSGRLDAGDVQVMSAGSGIRYEEKAHPVSPTRLFQLWLVPRRKGKTPGWEIRPFPRSDRSGSLTPLASGHGEAEAVPIDADARILAAAIVAGRTTVRKMATDRQAYLVVAKGTICLNGVPLREGDGAAAFAEANLRIEATEDAEILVVEIG